MTVKRFLAVCACGLALTACANDVACVDEDSEPPLCYEASDCYQGGPEGNAPDVEHTDATCQELGFTRLCGEDDDPAIYGTTSCPE